MVTPTRAPSAVEEDLADRDGVVDGGGVVDRDGRPTDGSGHRPTAETAPSSTRGAADVMTLRQDDRAWDRFVESVPAGQYPQLSVWPSVKASNGWRGVRVVADVGSGPIGAQVLLHKLGPSPWSLGYAPRGPVATTYDEASIRAFTAELRRACRRHQLTHVTIDPEVSDPAVAERLVSAGWRPSAKVQPERTWIIDLDQPEEAIWSGLRSKWRQYVQKARRSGVVVVDAGAEGLADFHAIVVETARRAGFLYRTLDSYRTVYERYAETGHARLLIAKLPNGEPGATVMLLGCGPRIVEPYGGMTQAGAESRANYLLKWEAMRSSREAGFTSYDMWGMANAGIEQFKRGFGGREVRYIGAFDLVRVAPIRSALLAAHAVRVRIARRGRAPEPDPGRDGRDSTTEANGEVASGAGGGGD
jgi:lipid II:glycine glycyltransferase (peptidoglycan interpeptide bridge formation enzyme)